MGTLVKSEGSLIVNQRGHCCPQLHTLSLSLGVCVQVISGWSMALSLQKGGWSCSMKESGGE